MTLRLWDGLSNLSLTDKSSEDDKVKLSHCELHSSAYFFLMTGVIVRETGYRK